MYQSPIDVLIKDVQMQFAEGVDEQVHRAVVNVGINVDKKELLRALAYDREQYVKGYAEGLEDAVKHGRWEDNREKGTTACTVCGFERSVDENFGRAVACPNCGARMDGDRSGN